MLGSGNLIWAYCSYCNLLAWLQIEELIQDEKKPPVVGNNHEEIQVIQNKSAEQMLLQFFVLCPGAVILYFTWSRLLMLKYDSGQKERKEIYAHCLLLCNMWALFAIVDKLKKYHIGILLFSSGTLLTLVFSLKYQIVWPESGWKTVPLVEIIEGNAVKRSYQRALLCLHPDKLQQKGATSQQKYIAEKVFDILQVPSYNLSRITCFIIFSCWKKQQGMHFCGFTQLSFSLVKQEAWNHFNSLGPLWQFDVVLQWQGLRIEVHPHLCRYHFDCRNIQLFCFY